MARFSLSLPLAVVVALLAPAAAPAAWFPADPVDGPSPDIVAVDDLDVARDGTGAVVWRRRVDGAPHVFVSRLAGGAWRGPERVDAPIPGGADEASVAAADGGRVAVFWISANRVYGAFAPAGSGPQPMSPPVLLHESLDGLPSSGLDAEMGINGTAYAVWRASGGGGGDVRAARLKGTAFGGLAAPLDITPANGAGIATGRPRVAVDAGGTGLATWGEDGKVFSRRLLGPVPSRYSQLVSLPELGGPADLPEVDVEEDGSFAWVAFRQFEATGSRALARRLVGSQYDPAAVLDTGAGAGPPVLSIDGRGHGSALVPAGGGVVLGADVGFDNRFRPPGRLDATGGQGVPEVALAASDRRQVAAAWRQDAGDGVGAVLGRFRRRNGQWEPEVALSRPEFGPVVPASLHVSGDRNSDTAVAFVQGGVTDRRVVIASWDRPPFRVAPQRGWVRESQPTLSWTGGGDLWGLQGFHVLVDGALAGATRGATSFQAPAPLPDGAHTLQVITFDRRGQAVASGVRTFMIDTAPPAAALQVTGQRRRNRRLTVRVLTADVGSGVGRVRVDYGDRTKDGRKASTVHRWARRGRYRVTASVADVAGNVTTATLMLRIRR
jgi:hypothetical protein